MTTTTSVPDLLNAAVVILRPDASQENRHQATNYLTHFIRNDEGSLGALINLLSSGILMKTDVLTSFELDGVKSLIGGMFYKRCKDGRYMNQDVSVNMTVDAINATIQFEQSLYLENQTGNMSLFGAQMCASRCVIAVHQYSTLDVDKMGPLEVLLNLCLMPYLAAKRNLQVEKQLYSPITALEILAALSNEMEHGSSLTMKQAKLLQQQCKDVVLSCVQSAFDLVASRIRGDESWCANSYGLGVGALKVLGAWAEGTQVSLVDVNFTRTQGSSDSILTFLILILSRQSNYNAKIIGMASRALTEIILRSTSDFSESHNRVISVMLQSVRERGFIISPFNHFSSNATDESSDVSHALAILASTFGCEEIERIATCKEPGCSELIELYINIQQHPSQSVSITVLEFWLNLQDIPIVERHQDLAAPLFSKILDVIINRVAYPHSFTTWDNEYELDSQQFLEMRNLVEDVLISSYYLLRVNYVNQLFHAALNFSKEWNVLEAVMFGFCSVSKEICASVKSMDDFQVDGSHSQAICDELLKLLHQLCSQTPGDSAIVQPLVVAAIAKFIGSFSSIWNEKCEGIELFQLLDYLYQCMGIPIATHDAAKSIKLVLNTCSAKLKSSLIENQSNIKGSPIIQRLVMIMDSGLDIGNVEDTLLITEGCTRFVMKLKPAGLVSDTICLIARPAYARLEHMTQQLSNTPLNMVDDSMVAIVVSTLKVIKQIFKFCDGVNDEKVAVSELLNTSWPVLINVTNVPLLRQNEDIMSSLLSVFGQLMKSQSEIINPHIPQLMSLIVSVFDESFHPNVLNCVAIATEIYGNTNSETEQSFRQLLSRLYHAVKAKVLNVGGPKNCSHLAGSFFELIRRYLLYSPGSLFSDDLTSILAFAVEVIVESAGERESTRAALLFLSQFINCKSLNMSEVIAKELKTSGGLIDMFLVQHGENLLKFCIAGLSGSSPQLLWPIIADCTFAIVLRLTESSNSFDDNVARKWTWVALSEANSSERLSDEISHLVLKVLFGLIISKGHRSKPMVKMLLTDFAKICKGEIGTDALLTYAI